MSKKIDIQNLEADAELTEDNAKSIKGGVKSKDGLGYLTTKDGKEYVNGVNAEIDGASLDKTLEP